MDFNRSLDILNRSLAGFEGPFDENVLREFLLKMETDLFRNDENSSECPICMETKPIQRSFECCKQHACERCVENCLRQNGKCPFCRSAIAFNPLFLAYALLLRQNHPDGFVRLYLSSWFPSAKLPPSYIMRPFSSNI